MLKAWVNGAFVPMNEAKISAFDAGFQHGIGLFETMVSRHGKIFRGLEHMERMQVSARVLGLVESLRPEALVDAAEATIAHNNMQDARVRVTLTGGDLNLLGKSSREARNDPTIVIQVQPPTPYPSSLFEQGVGVCVADGQLNVADMFAGHKTLWYWPRLHALQQAAAVGMQESLWFDVTRALACACVSNVFVVKDGVLCTPIARGEEATDSPVRSPVLPGVTRAAILSLAEEAGYSVRKERIEIEALLDADEIFLTNSGWHLLPVVTVEQRTIGSGAPGAVSIKLRELLLARMERETHGAASSQN